MSQSKSDGVMISKNSGKHNRLPCKTLWGLGQSYGGGGAGRA